MLRVAIFLVLLLGGCVTKIDVRVIDYETGKPVPNAIAISLGRWAIHPPALVGSPEHEVETSEQGTGRILVSKTRPVFIYAAPPLTTRSATYGRPDPNLWWQRYGDEIRRVAGRYAPVDPASEYVQMGDDGVIEIRLVRAPPRVRLFLPKDYRGPIVMHYQDAGFVRTGVQFDFAESLTKTFGTKSPTVLSRSISTNTFDVRIPVDGVFYGAFGEPRPLTIKPAIVFQGSESVPEGSYSVWDRKWTGTEWRPLPATPGGPVQLWPIWEPVYFIGTQAEAQRFESLLLRRPATEEAKAASDDGKPFVDPTEYLQLAVDLGDAREAEAELRRRKEQAGTLIDPLAD